jgi:hypothetical protein
MPARRRCCSAIFPRPRSDSSPSDQRPAGSRSQHDDSQLTPRDRGAKRRPVSETSWPTAFIRVLARLCGFTVLGWQARVSRPLGFVQPCLSCAQYRSLLARVSTFDGQQEPFGGMKEMVFRIHGDTRCCRQCVTGSISSAKTCLPPLRAWSRGSVACARLRQSRPADDPDQRKPREHRQRSLLNVRRGYRFRVARGLPGL